jgi:hypothetical protein
MAIGARILPTARGTTLFEGVSSPSDDGAKRILGQTYEVADVLHNTCHRVVLRAVQNDAAAAYTVPATGPTKFLKWQTTDIEDNGRKFNSTTNSQGMVGKPLDDYYSTRLSSIPDHDVAFVVEEGPCKVVSTTTAYTNGQAVTCGSTGKAEQAAAGDYVVGHAMTAYANTCTSILLYVTRGTVMGDKSA